MRSRLLALALVAAGLAAVLGTAACSSSSAQPDGLQIVASTDVYASIAREIAGGRAAVSSFLNSPSQDPHSYEADARDQLAISRADIVIENGGGYDDFMSRMRAASGEAGATVLDVVAISGKHKDANGDLNEHVWYDFPTVIKFARRLSAALTEQEPAEHARFARNTARFVAGVRALESAAASIRSSYAGTGVAITEPVPLYLLDACGLVNRTPAAFSEAIENGTDVSVGVLNQTLRLFSTGAVHALVYNEQTAGPQTSQVLDAARAHGVPTVPVTETLPAGRTYLSWMRANLAALRSALDA
jgi:zinc/manganese transport system substrate-binding protein